MPVCEVCGNDYANAFTVTLGGRQHTFDSFECAIHALAPVCAHCDCKVIGHGVERAGRVFCCSYCARHAEDESATGASRGSGEGARPHLHSPRRKNDRVQEASEESFPASDPPSWTLGTDRR